MTKQAQWAATDDKLRVLLLENAALYEGMAQWAESRKPRQGDGSAA